MRATGSGSMLPVRPRGGAGSGENRPTSVGDMGAVSRPQPAFISADKKFRPSRASSNCEFEKFSNKQPAGVQNSLDIDLGKIAGSWG